MAIRTPALERALAYVIRQARALRRQNRRRLPTAAQMAREAGTSHVTMLKAVGTLRAQHVLTVKPGRGITLTEGALPLVRAPLSETSRPVSERKWEQTVRRIESDVLQGVYREGDLLPPMKALADRYAVCHRTLSRALARLVAERTLVPDRRTYRARPFVPRASYTRIVLIARAEETSQRLAVFSDRTSRCLQLIENECSRLGLELVVVPYKYEGWKIVPTGPHRSVMGDAESLNMVLGFVVWSVGFAEESVAELLAQLSRTSKPVAVLDEYGFLPRMALPAGMHRTSFFMVGVGELCAREIGYHLLRLGHSRIVYLSPYHNNEWSRQRLAVLESVFARAGRGSAVIPVVDEHIKQPWDFVEIERAAVKRIENRLTVRKGETPVISGVLQTLRESLPPVYQTVATRHHSRRFYQRAYECTDATAWVAASDLTAIGALDFLEQHGEVVPNRISVAGFDDSTDAFYRSLTSYNFNIPAVMHAMVSHVVATARPRPGDKPAVVTIEGFLSVRKSTSSARTRS